MRRESAADRATVAGFTLVCAVFALVCLAPLWVALVASFSNEYALIRSGYQLWINQFDLTSYRLIFSGSDDVLRAYGVTILTTALGVGATLLLTAMTAFPLSLRTMRGRGAIAFFAYFTMLFNGGLVPNYILTVRFLRLKNNLLVLIIPAALNAYNLFLMRNYFTTLPESLAESARIDGAGDLRIFRSIALPLSKPILATIGLFAAMGYWNEWYRALLYIDRRNMFTLQFLIMKLQQQVDFLTSSMNPQARQSLGNIPVPTIGIRLATAMVSIGPIVLLYPFLQRYFIGGILIGSVKG
ncbi:MAG: carbohydrate ABC transporter permease [Oscillospiraceae bacterium]|nr:carbohydrate ABC transporter permease [Oscillospiraceae bacterium]